MDKRDKYSVNDGLPPFPGLKVPWEKSRSEVWDEISPKIVPVPRKTVRLKPYIRYAAAALIALLLSVGTFMRTYKQTVTADNLMQITLPDGSSVSLTEGTRISFHPYWWMISREVSFEGEGRFQVEKGSKFSVVSDRGSTSVLGTVFSVNTKDTRYYVSCEEGSVRVVSHIAESEVVLSPGENAEMQQNGTLERSTFGKGLQGSESFTFTAEPLSSVLKKIGEAYKVQIKTEIPDTFTYTGNFSADIEVESALHLVCKPFSLNVEQISEKEYIIGK